MVSPGNIPNSVEMVYLNDNNIVEIMPYTFFQKENLKKVRRRERDKKGERGREGERDRLRERNCVFRVG